MLRDGALQHPESQGTQGKAADSWAVDKPRDIGIGSSLRGQGSDSKAAIQAANADGTVQQRPEVKQRPDEDLILPKQVNPGHKKPQQQQQQGQGLRQERPVSVKEQPEPLQVAERPKKQQTPGKPGLPLDFDWQTYLLYNPELQQVSCDMLLHSASCMKCPTVRQSLVMMVKQLVTMKQWLLLLATPCACIKATSVSCLCLLHSLMCGILIQQSCNIRQLPDDFACQHLAGRADWVGWRMPAGRLDHAVAGRAALYFSGACHGAHLQASAGAPALHSLHRADQPALQPHRSLLAVGGAGRRAGAAACSQA